MSIFFTADTHFGHRNIIKYAKRPFAFVEEMDEILIQNWNRVVGHRDAVYHLGDFNYRSDKPTEYYVDRLNGRIHLVLGNHDDKYAKKAHTDSCNSNKIALSSRNKFPLFENVQDVKYLHYHGEKITLYHYAQRVWRNSHHGAWHLYGHSHGSLPHFHRSMDVGVDCHDYTPVSFETVKAYMDAQPVTLHHPELVSDPWDKSDE